MRLKLHKTISTMALALAASVSLACGSGPAFAETPSKDKMWEIIKQQQRQIQALKRRGGDPENLKNSDSDADGLFDEDFAGAGGWWTKTSLGGYGELHLNTGDKDQIDFHRYVLFINHDFNDWIKLYSELELEHSLAGDGKPGEVELEQAYIHFDITEDRFGQVANAVSHVKLGLQLIPVGILNANHEPPTFYGVERNDVEKNIIPTTWWEAGALIGGKLADTGIFWDAMVHSGLDTKGKFTPRSGRQKVAEATSNNPAFTGRLGWTNGEGIEIAGVYQFQSDVDPGNALGGDKAEGSLFEVHANIVQPINDTTSFGLRALYAQWDFDHASFVAAGADEQVGYYIEPSVKFDLGNIGAIGFFYRYEMWDNTAGDAVASEFSRQTVGANYWPHENVVLKADYRMDDHDDVSKEDDRLDLGVGFQF